MSSTLLLLVVYLCFGFGVLLLYTRESFVGGPVGVPLIDLREADKEPYGDLWPEVALVPGRSYPRGTRLADDVLVFGRDGVLSVNGRRYDATYDKHAAWVRTDGKGTVEVLDEHASVLLTVSLSS